MIEHKSIQEAMLAIYGEVGYVQKQKGQNLNYTFASEKEFIKALRPSMIEHGVFMFVGKMDQLNQTEYTTGKGSLMLRSTVHGIVTFSHISGTQITVDAYGEGSDSGDKSLNKAMTDMYKYALRQTFMIETGDDPDKDKQEPVTKKAEQSKTITYDSGFEVDYIEKLAETHKLTPVQVNSTLKLCMLPKFSDISEVGAWFEKYKVARAAGNNPDASASIANL